MGLVHSIAGFEFIEIRGSLVARTRQLEVLARRGKDDVAVRLLALRSRAVQVETVNYVTSFLTATQAIDAYSLLKDGEAYPVTQYSVDLGDFLVLEVEETERRAVTNVMGGLTGGETVRQVCRWTLMHVEMAPPQNP